MKHFVWFFLILLIFVRYYTSRPIYKTGDRVRITSTIYSDPVYNGNYVYAKIAGLIMYLPVYPVISYADRITVEGVIDGNKLLDAKIVKVENSGYLAFFRNKITSFYTSFLPQPESGLVAGIVLGNKNAVSQGFYEQTKNVGLTHVVVASGTNITFVVSFLSGILYLFLPRRKAIPFLILGIIFYLFLSGFEAPLIRAAVMSCFIFLGQGTGRLVATWRIFFFTIFFMLVINPNWLGDLGFILSFASTAGLMLFEKKIRDFISSVPEVLKEGLSTSLAAQIGVAPIIFATFGQFNILSPLINALVLWTIPYIMILGSIGGILGLIFPLIGKLLLYIMYPLVWWFSFVTKSFSGFP